MHLPFTAMAHIPISATDTWAQSCSENTGMIAMLVSANDILERGLPKRRLSASNYHYLQMISCLKH